MRRSGIRSLLIVRQAALRPRDFSAYCYLVCSRSLGLGLARIMNCCADLQVVDFFCLRLGAEENRAKMSVKQDGERIRSVRMTGVISMI